MLCVCVPLQNFFFFFQNQYSVEFLTSSYSEVNQDVTSVYMTLLWSVYEFGTNKPPLNFRSAKLVCAWDVHPFYALVFTVNHTTLAHASLTTTDSCLVHWCTRT